jgi:hypothetical protein
MITVLRTERRSKIGAHKIAVGSLVVALAVVALAVVGRVAAEPAQSGDHNQPVRIKQVALFKNGLGYFRATADLPQGKTTVQFGQLPVPVHGTFWVSYPEDIKVLGLFTRMEEVRQVQPVATMAQLLQANAGREVTVTTSHGVPGEQTLHGRILEGSAEGTSKLPNPYVMGGKATTAVDEFAAYPNSSLILFETDTGIVGLAADSILRIHFEDAAMGREQESGTLVTTLPVLTRRPSLRMELLRPAKGQEVGINFLASGITWAPSYQIDLSDPKTARFSGKALVINEVADLDDVRLELVTGFPNVMFAKVRSPMAMSQDLSQFLASLASRGEGRNAGVLGQQAVMFNQADFTPALATPQMNDPAAGQGNAAEDLFFYPVNGVRLARGETALLPLFTATMPYEHIYTWEVADKLDGNERYQRNDSGRKVEEVWHACRLLNTLSMPLTTAPAEFVTDGRFTGQGIAYYTAPGMEATIRINRALNVVAEELELELERHPGEKRILGYRYQRVKIEGQLKLANHSGKEVRVEVTKELTGEVITTAPTARDIPIARGLKGANPRHQLIWEVDLDSGATRTLTYVYEVYLRL